MRIILTIILVSVMTTLFCACTPSRQTPTSQAYTLTTTTQTPSARLVSTPRPTSSPTLHEPTLAPSPLSATTNSEHVTSLLVSPYLTNAPDRDLFSLSTRLQYGSNQATHHLAKSEPISLEVGALDVLWVADVVDKKMYQVEAELLHVSDHAYWYFEKGFAPTQAILAATAQSFEEDIYPVVTEVFGTERTSGVDNDLHISILHTPLKQVAGYYNPSDEYPTEISPFSNERHMFYMNTSAFPVGSDAYLGTLAHEFQHALHWPSDPGEEGWVNEGLSEVARNITGYASNSSKQFMLAPSTSLTAWPSIGSTQPHYGAASLFIEYLAEHYGGHRSLGQLVSRPEDGGEGITAYLKSLGYGATFQAVFGDWVVANYLDLWEIEPYTYSGLDVAVPPSVTIDQSREHIGAGAQYSAEYIEVSLDTGGALLSFQGQSAAALLPSPAHSGTSCWWSNRGDSIDSTLTASIDLSEVTHATMNFWVWFAIEESWDYAYVEASVDGGQTWDILEGSLTSPKNPLGLSFGPGYTGQSKGWQKDSVDLTQYAGAKILLRFEYVTDAAVNDHGMCIDDISIPEIGYFDNAEDPGAWDTQGFVMTDNRVPQSYLIKVIEFREEVSVREMSLDQAAKGNLTIAGFGEDLDRAVVIIAPLAPKTTLASPYLLSVKTIP